MKPSLTNDSTIIPTPAPAPTATSTPTTNESDFDSVLFQSIDEAMGVLGDAGKQAIYLYLDKSFQLKKEDLAKRIDDFSVSLEKMFGIGANFIYDLILKIVSQKLSMDPMLFDLNKHSFPVCVSMARTNPHSRQVAA